MTTVHALVLAAGAARRFGSPKGLADYRGRPLVRHVVESLQAALHRRHPNAEVTVVLGSDAERLSAALDGSKARLVINSDWELGLSSSIRAGIRSLPTSTTAVLMTLADQALVSSEDYQNLLVAAHANPHVPAAARYADTLGVPAVFPAEYFELLCALAGDRGAGGLLQAAEGVIAVDMPSAAFDIDTPEQLATAIRS